MAGKKRSSGGSGGWTLNRLASVGGKARAKSMTKAQRKASARKAGKASGRARKK